MRPFAAIILIFFILFGVKARAEETVYYYLELGDEPNQQAAETKWEKLSESHAAVLGGLEFHPTIILRADRTVIIRIHAGPLDGKNAAQKKCLQLFALGTPCFVLEGGKRPYAAGSTGVQGLSPDNLPWSAESLLPWLSRDRRTGEAEVEVAEAIRVPLPEEMGEAPEIRPTFAPVPEMRESRDVIRGWVDVRPFKDEQDAIAFWQSVRRVVPEMAAGLRVRVTRPLAERDAADTALHIGPFAGEQDAMEFCRAGIAPVSGNVLCRFTEAEPGIAEPLLSDRYMRREYSPQAPATGSPAAEMPGAKGAWVQILSASGEEEALKAWERLRSEHGDILGSFPNHIEASPEDGGYAVRIGPFAINSDAISLCIRLQQRGIHCRIYNR